ncbi:MAG: 4-hydroxybenzoate octaprenyltransferase [Gammaproteobacteria bacterium]|nr:4-hydroxybenzoate octaprenyltransferase [Gammaproteobacteria bacterium]
MPDPGLAGRLREYGRLMRVDRPIGTYLLLWPALWALWLSSAGHPDPVVLLVFVAGVFLMRSAGCVINDYADRHFDGHVARTRDRPLARGAVTPREALVLFAVLCALAFALVLLLNPLTVAMSLVAVLLAAIYPYFKRITHLPQLVLGLAFSWSIPMAYTAHTDALPPFEAWLLYGAAVMWTVAYDTMYAMVDRVDDVRIGIKSTAVLFGGMDRLIIGVLQAMVLVLLGIVGQLHQLGAWYYAGLVVAAGLAIREQAMIRHREPARCFAAFLHNSWFGAAVFGGIFLHYLLA